MGAEEQPVQTGDEGGIGGTVIDRAGDDQTVCRFKLGGNFVYGILEHAFSVFPAITAGYAAPDGLFADLDTQIEPKLLPYVKLATVVIVALFVLADLGIRLKIGRRARAEEIAVLQQIRDLARMLPGDDALTEASAKAVNDALEAARKAEDVDALKAALDDLAKAAEALEFKPNTFKDVKDDDWFKPAVDFAEAAGLMNGVGENMFAPYNDMTRAMVVTVLYRFAGEPDVTGLECPFKDLKEDWYKDAVVWAYYMGVTTGKTQTEFYPYDPVTREQMAAFIARFLFGPEQSEEGMIEELRGTLARAYYSDAASIDKYAVEPVLTCSVNQIMRGDKAAEGQKLTIFRPLDTMNRAECAQVLKNVYDFALDSVLPKADTAPAALSPAA